MAEEGAKLAGEGERGGSGEQGEERKQNEKYGAESTDSRTEALCLDDSSRPTCVAFSFP